MKKIEAKILEAIAKKESFKDGINYVVYSKNYDCSQVFLYDRKIASIAHSDNLLHFSLGGLVGSLVIERINLLLPGAFKIKAIDYASSMIYSEHLKFGFSFIKRDAWYCLDLSNNELKEV